MYFNKRVVKSVPKVVVQGKNGWASYPMKLSKPIPQEKLFEEYWK